MDGVRDLQTLALHAVLKKTGAYNLRYIFRWYSQRFHTPLHVVEALPLEDVLRHYYECEYEDLEPHEIANAIKLLSLTDEELARLRKEEDAEDADSFELVAAERKPRPQAPAVPVDTEEQRIQKLKDSFKAPQQASVLPQAEVPQTLASLQKLPEGIQIDFDEGGDSLGIPDDTE